jgi:hypothetical protein
LCWWCSGDTKGGASNKVHNIHEKNNQIVVTNLAEAPVANEDDVMRCVRHGNGRDEA